MSSHGGTVAFSRTPSLHYPIKTFSLAHLCFVPDQRHILGKVVAFKKQVAASYLETSLAISRVFSASSEILARVRIRTLASWVHTGNAVETLLSYLC